MNRLQHNARYTYQQTNVGKPFLSAARIGMCHFIFPSSPDVGLTMTTTRLQLLSFGINRPEREPNYSSPPRSRLNMPPWCGTYFQDNGNFTFHGMVLKH